MHPVIVLPNIYPTTVSAHFKEWQLLTKDETDCEKAKVQAANSYLQTTWHMWGVCCQGQTYYLPVLESQKKKYLERCAALRQKMQDCATQKKLLENAIRRAQGSTPSFFPDGKAAGEDTDHVKVIVTPVIDFIQGTLKPFLQTVHVLDTAPNALLTAYVGQLSYLADEHAAYWGRVIPSSVRPT